MIKKLTLTILIITLFYSCDRVKYPKGHYPDIVTNFTEVNSEYDDYNSDLDIVFGGFNLCFSSNRHSKGNDFDIILYNVDITWDQRIGKLNMNVSNEIQGDNISLINTPNNELGPYSFITLPYNDLFLYASDENGDYNINYLWNSKIFNVEFLKTESNELYPSFYGKDVYFTCRSYDKKMEFINKIEKIIYCSDKDGNFDIYEVNIPQNSNIVDVIRSSEAYPSIKLDINSNYDDKCPFVNGSLLVFSSNRPGGYGGYDLYFSIYENGAWSQPTNFGANINSEYDEYRPITHFEHDFDNNLMIFSSNRPRGLGGFDLYYVGIPKNIKIQ
ncbi:hypothetical protein LJC68_10755 [Bacteroidales bacterium OttesenSCG-928-B11]|nr:hypothetical protein [Bacteroidales bacterium OttesenSCG-928-B11]